MIHIYYAQIDENDENILQKSIARCGSIIAELDVVCGKDNYFFGRKIF